MKFIGLKLLILTLYIYAFSQSDKDTLITKKTYFLKLTPELTVDTINIDTNFFHIHQYGETFMKTGISICNGVSAYYNFKYDFVSQYPLWINSLNIHYHLLSQRYFHTHVPFTQVRLIGNTNRTYNEEIVKVIHTQNINKKWNVGIEGISNKNIGKIPRQDNRFHYLLGSTNYQGNRYYLWANYFFSKLKTKENGGVKEPSFLTDSLFPPENATIYLQNANNKYVIQNFSLQQWYKLSKTDSLNHNFKPWIVHQSFIFKAKKIYTDSQLDTLFYSNVYIDSLKTYDSLFYQLQRHSLGIAIGQHPNKGTGAMLSAQNVQRTSYSYSLPLRENAIAVNLTYYIRNSKFNATTLLNYGISGYMENSMNIEINYNKKIKRNIIWENKVSYENKEPDVFENNFRSNHYQWTYNFPFRKIFFFESSLVKDNDKISIWAIKANNTVVFNNFQNPTIASDLINIGTNLNKLIKWKNIYSFSKLMFQWLNDTTIRVPNATAYTSLFYQNKFFKKVLTIQFGADVWCHSIYKAVGYSPVLNVFYSTNSSNEVGLYPVINVFLNASLKRARFFVKMEHLNYQWYKANFFSVYAYSLPSRMLKFGIYWNFYD